MSAQTAGTTLGRPRDPDVDRRVATAAVQLYGELGWAGFNIEAVARRAGVGKTSIYLRWSNREDLLVDALRTRVGDVAQVDTGAVRTDLVYLARQFLALYLGDAGPAAMRLSVEADHPAAGTRPATTRQHRLCRKAGRLPPLLRLDFTPHCPRGAQLTRKVMS